MRDELGLPATFPDEVTAAAEAAAARGSGGNDRRDATDLRLVTIDPPGSMDLDQAMHLARQPGSGYRVSYAIADLAAFISAGDPVDTEARHRGETYYSPDLRTPLHPPALSEGAASLLEGQDTPALLWTIDLDADGATTSVHLERALVRSVGRLDYPSVQTAFDAGSPPDPVEPLADIGRLRLARARDRKAIELGMPEQDVVQAADGSWTIDFRASAPVETWNAQISLLTGIAAARLMLDANIGLLRTLPPPDPRTVEHLQRAATPLGIDWPEGLDPGGVLATLDPSQPRHAAFLDLAAEMLRGAGYQAFDGSPPAQPDHSGIGGPYAHVTAPIRRLADRYANEVCVSVANGTAVPDWARQALPLLPQIMAGADSLAHKLERRCVDRTEAWLLADRVGEVFDAAVVDVDDKGGNVVLDDPAVRARCGGAHLPLGERIAVRLTQADLATATVRFEPA